VRGLNLTHERAAAMFSQIAFQVQLIASLHEVSANAVGEHVHRRRRGVCKKARLSLMKRGYSEKDATQIVRDAWDMWHLETICE